MALQDLNALLCGVRAGYSRIDPPAISYINHESFQNHCYKLIFLNMVGLMWFHMAFKMMTFFCHMAILLLELLVANLLLTFLQLISNSSLFFYLNVLEKFIQKLEMTLVFQHLSVLFPRQWQSANNGRRLKILRHWFSILNDILTHSNNLLNMFHDWFIINHLEFNELVNKIRSVPASSVIYLA